MFNWAAAAKQGVLLQPGTHWCIVLPAFVWLGMPQPAHLTHGSMLDVSHCCRSTICQAGASQLADAATGGVNTPPCHPVACA